ncbi:MAG TPA: thioredoxin domain-containing protein [Panacibacter sp.]|nr:thioredoxin domain-containing protein [Panacibacter sp.]
MAWLISAEIKTKMTKALSLKNFKKEVIERRTLSLVQFKAEWNGTCQIIAPVFESLSAAYKKKVSFFTVDVEENKLLEAEHGVTDIPTILFFKNGKMIDHLIGLAPRNVIIEKIENALA